MHDTTCGSAHRARRPAEPGAGTRAARGAHGSATDGATRAAQSGATRATFAGAARAKSAGAACAAFAGATCIPFAGTACAAATGAARRTAPASGGVLHRTPRTLRAALAACAAALGLGAAAPAAAQGGTGEPQKVVATERGDVAVVTFARGLQQPWGLAFLPDGRMLVTEKPGRLRIVDAQGALSEPVTGVPRVFGRGQGGLLDVAVSPAFATDRTVFLSYAEPTERGGRTAVARGVLDGGALSDMRVIFRQRPESDGGNHWGSRLVFGRDGTLFVTLGDRFTLRDGARDLGTHLGKVVRIRPDGSVPPDNPFVGRAGALPEIWSFGHRNVQGAALHPSTGRLWTHEHGPQGGDELNVTLAGNDHGWPTVTYGREYGSGARIGEGTEKPGVQPPVVQWTPSIAPSGMAFHPGGAFPSWQGNLLVGALKFRSLYRLELDGERVVRQERMLEDLGQRIRDVRVAPDGRVYLLVDDSQGGILRLQPR
jgi:glucose/arabinose dehydrogenase